MAMSVLDRKGDFTDKERALSSIAPLRNVDRHIALPPNRTSDLSLIVTDPTQSLDQKSGVIKLFGKKGLHVGRPTRPFYAQVIGFWPRRLLLLFL